MRNCPYCQTSVKHLKDHVKRMHPDKLAEFEGEAMPTGSELELNTEGLKKPESQGYHCVDCGASVSHRQAVCSGCGATLEWGEL